MVVGVYIIYCQFKGGVCIGIGFYGDLYVSDGSYVVKIGYGIFIKVDNKSGFIFYRGSLYGYLWYGLFFFQFVGKGMVFMDDVGVVVFIVWIVWFVGFFVVVCWVVQVLFQFGCFMFVVVVVAWFVQIGGVYGGIVEQFWVCKFGVCQIEVD